MKHIRITSIDVIKMEDGDAGSLYDAIGEAIILSIRSNKVVKLRSEKCVRFFDPIIIRDSVAEVMNVPN